MAGVKHLLYFVVVSVQLLAFAESQSCSPSDIDRCANHLSPVNAEIDLASFNETNLRIFCEALSTYKQCLNAIKPYCDRLTTLVIDGVVAFSDYVCSNEGRSLVSQHSPCLRRVEVETASVGCTSGLDVAARISAEALCREVRYAYLECTRDVVTRYCGREAANFVLEATLLLLEPIYGDFLGCSLTKVSVNSTTLTTTPKWYPTDSWYPLTTRRIWYPEDTRSTMRSPSTCTVQNIESCNLLFSSINIASDVADLNQEKLEEYCRIKSQHHRCLSQIQPSCDSGTRYFLEGIKDVTDYVCTTEGRRLALQHFGCIGNAYIGTDAEACSDRFRRAVINDRGVCQAFFYSVNDCLYGAISKRCGQMAARYGSELAFKLDWPYLKNTYNCKGSGHKLPVSIVAVITGLLLVLFI